jgi:hypothetical protein
MRNDPDLAGPGEERCWNLGFRFALDEWESDFLPER